MSEHQAYQKALETFLLDNPELAQLEVLLDEFNIFETVGAVRQDVCHSDSLALFNSRERHGLGATFVQRLLATAVLDLCHVFHETAQSISYTLSVPTRREALIRPSS